MCLISCGIICIFNFFVMYLYLYIYRGFILVKVICYGDF